MLIRSNQRAPRKRRLAELLALSTLSMALLFMISACTKEEVLVPVDETLVPSESGHTKAAPASKQLLAYGFQLSLGSTVGPDGALYIPEGITGEISRVDVHTGDVSTFASDLPAMLPWVGIGGPVDVVFRDGVAYALVSLVSPYVGGTETTGIYRIDGSNNNTPIADIATFNVNHQPPEDIDVFVPSGVLYAIEAYRDGFLVTDGHLNRVLYVTLDGDITILRQFDNIVPTGLDLSGNKVYMAEAGPSPHDPEVGKVVSFVHASPKVKDVASGAPLLVDVEFGFAQRLFALSQGTWHGTTPGDPADEYSGSLVRVNPDGTFTTIIDELNRPTSLEFIRNTAYIVTLTGEVWSVENVKSEVPF
jgi:hypothetical protein